MINLCKNILVLNNHGLGDVVMSFNFFENLLLNDDKSQILVFFKSNLEKELFLLTKFYSENKKRFNLYSRSELKKIFFYIFRIEKAFALGINEAKSKKLFRILRIKNFYIAHPYEYVKSLQANILHNENMIHKSNLYTNLLNISGFSNLKNENKDFFIDLDYINQFGKYIVITGGSGELEKHKRWTINGYRELIIKLIDNTKYNIVFVGSLDEQKIVDQMLKGIKNCYLDRIFELNGKTNLNMLIGVLRNSNLVVGNDNGILHIASACNKKLLGLFGSTNFKITGPTGNNIEIVDNKVECSPCYGKDGNIQGCEDNKCMKSINSEQVWNKVESML